VTPASSAGRLVLVATPIGNLGDLSPRAVATLEEADLICCEDTRRTRQLLTYAGVTGARLISLHGHNEATRVAQVLGRVAEGQTVAVVSDAGTPAVSDPGARLVAAAVAAGATVSVVPGPSAALAALVVSGLPTDRFSFEGFLPRRSGSRRRRLEAIAGDDHTVVIYEAPGRVADTLGDLAAACGPDRRVAVARELTKVHEEVWRGSLGGAVDAFGDRELRGEVVVVVSGATSPASPPTDDELAQALQPGLDAGDSVRDVAGEVAERLGVPRRRAYAAALALRRNVAP
jgi:16S rRNA (cytidine1402-2'-O)-methyltransferase